MSEIEIPDPNQLAQLCFNIFDSLPKSGKPIANKEWTVLSCIAKYHHETMNIEIVALGTGKLIILR